MIFQSPGAILLQLTIPWYAILLGLVVAVVVVLRMVKKWNLPRWSSEWWIVNGLLFAFVSLVIGSRVKFVLKSWPAFADKPLDALTTWSFPLTVRWYGLMIALGFISATILGSRLAQRWELDPEKIVNGALISFIGGILGARLYFVAISWDYFSQHPFEILATWNGGMSIHGGIIGGFLVGAIFCRQSKLPVLTCLDLGATVTPLAQAIGRWGNFFNSEAFGKPVGNGFPLKLYIPMENRPFPFGLNNYFHPTFLYECVWNLGMFFLFYFVLSKKLVKYPGTTFLIYIALYSIGRLLIEPLRTDSIMAGSMPVPIIASAVCLALSVLSLIGATAYYAKKYKTSQSNAETNQQTSS